MISHQSWVEFKHAFLAKRLSSLQLSMETEIRSPHIGSISCLSIEDIEDRYLLSGGGYDGRVSLFDFECTANPTTVSDRIRGSRLMTPFAVSEQIGRCVSSLQWYPLDLGCFIASTMDGKVTLWDTTTYQVVSDYSMGNTVYSARCNPGGTLIAVGTDSPEVAIIDPMTGGTSQKLVGHKSGIACLEWCPDAEYMLASGAYDGSVKIWDTRRGGARALLTTFDWRQDCISSEDTTKWKTDWSKDDTVRAHEGAIMSMCFTSSGQHLITSGNDRIARVWSVSNKDLGSLENKNIPTACTSRLPYQIMVSEVASELTDLLFVPCGSTGEIRVNLFRDLSNSEALSVLKGHLDMVQGIAIRKPTQEVISAGKDGLILLWNPRKADGKSDIVEELYRDDWSDDEVKQDQRDELTNEDEAVAYLPPILRQLLQNEDMES